MSNHESFASAQQEYNDLSARFNQLQAEFDQLQAAVDSGAGVSAVATRVLTLRQRVETNLAFVQYLQDNTIPDIADADPNSVQSLYNATGTLRDRYNDLLDSTFDLTRQAQQNDQKSAIPDDLFKTDKKDGAGDIVSNEQDANAEGASVQSPDTQDVTLNDKGRVVAQPENTNTGTNAKPAVTGDDAQVNDTSDAALGGDTVSTVGGGGATKTAGNTTYDDATDVPQTTTGSTAPSGNQPAVAKEFLDKIVAKPNTLSALSNMTYSLSLYLMSPDEFSLFVEAEEKVLPTRQLILQSAGANKEDRNEWFNVDFYIENFKLESIVGTQGVGSSHNAVTLEFDVVEPQGITFLNRLNNAVRDQLGVEANQANAGVQGYLMVIRFYGYNASGLPVTAAELGLPQTTDANAVVEKFIPFNITNFTYKIGPQLTQYNIKGACAGTNVAFSTQRGEIPFQLQLTAGTVNQLFNGNTVMAETQATEAGQTQTGSTGTVVYGLTQALNKHQRQLVSKGSIGIADEYEIVFQDPDIKNAQLLKPGNANKGTASNQTNQQAAQKFLNSKLNYNKKDRSWSVPAGTQIVQLLDLVLRTSSYITSQQNFIFDEKTGKYKKQESKVPTVQWYRVKSKVVPIGYDEIRKTIAYKITYIVNKYQINTPRSPHFPTSQYRGVHKLYNWVFTGLNTEILDFEIDVNSNYYVVIGTDGLKDDTPNGSIPVQQSFSSAPGQSLQGGENNSTFPAANLSDRLYNPGDVARSEIEIVGDPDWIQQSELVYNKSAGLSAFLPDGSINYDSQEVLYEVRFNPGQDYDLRTGLARVDENNRTIHADGAIIDTNVAQESLVFNAITVTSTFADGKFTQRIQGVYRDFAGAKDASPDDQVKPAKTVDSEISKKKEGEGREKPTGAIVGGKRTNAGGAANREKAQAQRDNLNNGVASSVSTRSPAGQVEGIRRGQRVRPNTGPASRPNTADDDAGSDTPQVAPQRIGGRSNRARRR